MFFFLFDSFYLKFVIFCYSLKKYSHLYFIISHFLKFTSCSHWNWMRSNNIKVQRLSHSMASRLVSTRVHELQGRALSPDLWSDIFHLSSPTQVPTPNSTRDKHKVTSRRKDYMWIRWRHTQHVTSEGAHPADLGNRMEPVEVIKSRLPCLSEEYNATSWC